MQKIKLLSEKKIGWKTIVFFVALIVIIVVVTLVGSIESYTGTPGFCGTSCHIMEPAYESWKGDKHRGNTEKKVASCVQCHYAPGERMTLKAKAKGVGQLFTYLATGEKEIRKATHIDDRSCMASACHPKGDFFTKKLKYTEREGAVPFEHKAHMAKAIEGQVLHCSSCHRQVPGSKKHFEVSKDLCYTCHFRNSEFNKGLAKCELCHAIPTNSLQKQKNAEQGDNPITHQSLAENKVPCASCHLGVVAGTDDLKPQACHACHSNPDVLAKGRNMKLMHEKHVAEQKAGCLDCHIPKQHNKKIDFVNTTLQNCAACHPGQHSYQVMLLAGPEREGVPQTPALMQAVNTNCLACHIKEEQLKGTMVAQGDSQACVSCHKAGHREMLERWEREVEDGLRITTNLEKEARLAIGALNSTMIPAAIMEEASGLYEKGLEDLHIVEYGNGVHNKKYSLMLLNNAMINFEDALAVIEDAQQ